MTQAINNPVESEVRRQQWVARAESLINQIEQWSVAQGWATARTERTVNERSVGQYAVPVLRVRLPLGEIHVIPVALNVIGAEGRVDLEAFPALNRVKLISQGGEWEIYTDSNVPLRQPWDASTFIRLAQDLVA